MSLLIFSLLPRPDRPGLFLLWCYLVDSGSSSKVLAFIRTLPIMASIRSPKGQHRPDRRANAGLTAYNPLIGFFRTSGRQSSPTLYSGDNVSDELLGILSRGHSEKSGLPDYPTTDGNNGYLVETIGDFLDEKATVVIEFNGLSFISALSVIVTIADQH